MAEGFTQLAANSTGNKIRENTKTISSNVVSEQSVYQTARQTFIVIAEDCAFAASKQHLSIYNGEGSGMVLRINKLFITNMLANVTVSGGARRFDVKRATAFSAGTDIVPVAHDTSTGVIPSEILIKTGCSLTEGALLFPLVFPDDEMLLTQNSMAQQLFSGINWIPEGLEIQDLTLNEGEGITIKQVTSSSVGVTTWIVIFNIE